VRLALDDFGTGYSSLSYLQRLPLDGLKIDRTFVGRLGQDGDAGAIVQAIITLAHALDLRVTGEGIETAEQLEELRRLGCDHGQGYYFAKPLTPDAVAALLTAASGAAPSAT
jgi:EAL domain-containing protein (putative c-di-GMP-specific phosphodiesterase class I)